MFCEMSFLPKVARNLFASYSHSLHSQSADPLPQNSMALKSESDSPIASSSKIQLAESSAKEDQDIKVLFLLSLHL